MSELILSTKDCEADLGLIYLEDRDVAGIHYRGLARLLGCDQKTVANAAKGVNPKYIESIEIQTGGGIQGVNFILEPGVVEALRIIRRSKRIKQETIDAAEDLYDRFAEAGFKLYAMLQVAPSTLKRKFNQEVQPQSAISLSSADMLIQMTQVLAVQAQAFKEHELRMAAIESENLFLKRQVEEMQQRTAMAHKELIALPTASHEVPPESTDMKIRRIVNNYCVSTGQQQAEVYRNLYQQFYYRYRRNVQTLERESKIKAFIRLGLIDALYDLAVELFVRNSAEG